MWLLHEDKTHFDLIIRKDSVLSEKEGIYQMNCDKNSETKGEINKHAAKEHIGCKCDKCVYKSKVYNSAIHLLQPCPTGKTSFLCTFFCLFVHTNLHPNCKN